MARSKRDTRPGRRSPRQRRAVETVDAIVGAAAQILSAAGQAGLTTNKVAQRAGVSIGTLYQYFDDKEAILVALGRRLLEQDRASMFRAVEEALARPGVDLARVAVREVVRLYEVKPRVRRAVMETMIGQGLAPEVGATVVEFGRRMAQQLRVESAEAEGWSMRLLMAALAVEGVVRAMAYADDRALGSAAFEDALVQMARGLLPELTALGR